MAEQKPADDTTPEQKLAVYIFDALQNRCTVEGSQSELHSEAKRFMALIAQKKLIPQPPTPPKEATPKRRPSRRKT
jgi:hypothetical protein